MIFKCADILALIKAIINKFNILPDETQLGKRIFRIDGCVCTIFNNGTVQFQGKANSVAQAEIEQYIETINKLYA